MTPSTPITSTSFRYVMSAFTDITKTFVKHGFIPPDHDVQTEKRKKLNEVIYE